MIKQILAVALAVAVTAPIAAQAQERPKRGITVVPTGQSTAPGRVDLFINKLKPNLAIIPPTGTAGNTTPNLPSIARPPEGAQPGGDASNKDEDAPVVKRPRRRRPPEGVAGNNGGNDKPNVLFAVRPPEGQQPAESPAVVNPRVKPNANNNNGGGTLRLRRPPEGTQTAGNGGGNAGNNKPDVLFDVRPPEGTRPGGNSGGEIVDRSEPGTTTLPLIIDPQGTDPDADEADVADEETFEAPDPRVTTRPEDLGIGDEDAADEPSRPWNADVESAEDLYNVLVDRGYGVSIMRRDDHGRYVFLVGRKGGRYAYLLLVDDDNGYVLKGRKIDLARYFNNQRDYNSKRDYERHDYTPNYRRTPDNCRPAVRRYQSYGYGRVRG